MIPEDKTRIYDKVCIFTMLLLLGKAECFEMSSKQQQGCIQQYDPDLCSAIDRNVFLVGIYLE